MANDSRAPRLAVALAAILFLPLALPASAQIPDTFTNLEVLPADMGKGELIGVMRDFAGALGVRCNYCHVGEDPNSLDGYDFASDEKKAKRDARVMMKMTHAINADFVSQLGDDAPVQVKCVTCHRGQDEPRMIQDVLSQSMEEGGLEAMAAKYSQLREEYYGRHTFDFGEFVLTSMAEESARGGDMDTAQAMLEMNLEHLPKSEYTHMLLGQVMAQKGDTQRAIELFEKILELNPENERAQRMLARLKGE